MYCIDEAKHITEDGVFYTTRLTFVNTKTSFSATNTNQIGQHHKFLINIAV